MTTDNLKPITVSEFIEYLKQQPQHAIVAYQCCSEQVQLDLRDIELKKLPWPRPDGWIHHARPDLVSFDTLLLPGN